MNSRFPKIQQAMKSLIVEIMLSRMLFAATHHLPSFEDVYPGDRRRATAGIPPMDQRVPNAAKAASRRSKSSIVSSSQGSLFLLRRLVE